MENVNKVRHNGKMYESFELDKDTLLFAASNPNVKMESAEPYIQEWIKDESLDKEYREWLQSCLDRGMEVYTLFDFWQPIGEFAY